MARWLKQSTSVDVPIGPFVNSTDGFTAETGLTLTQPDIRLKKNAGAWAQKAAAQTLSHEENGYYEVTLDATDTNTLGLLRLAVNETGALPVWEDFLVVPVNVWDSFFGADKLQVHADEITAGLITADAIATGAIDADSIAADAITAAKIADGAIDAATFAAGAINAAAIASDAITDAKVASDVTIASVTGAVGSVTGAVGSVTGAVGSIAAGGITAASFAANAINAAKLDPDVTTELQAGLATAAALAVVDGIVDDILVDTGTTLQAELDGIQADTEDIQTRLPAALVNGRMNSNVAAISDDAPAADNLETMLDGTGGQVLSLKQLNVVNSTGTAIVASSSGSNGHGIDASGNGTGEGLKATGGATGHGIEAVGGAIGMRIAGGSNVGLAIDSGTGQAGIEVTALSGDTPAIAAFGSGSGAGVFAQGGGSTGAGIEARGGNSGAGILAAGGGTAGDGISAAGDGDGDGMRLTPGSTSGNVALRSSDFSAAVATDGGNSATSFKTTLTQAEDDHWKDAFLRITSGDLHGQVKKVSAYNGTTKFITLIGGFTDIPADAVTFDLVNE
jgi:hypothetical protein